MTNAAPYAPGDLVRVVDGPFASFKGVVREVDAQRDELSVEVTLLGRPTPIRTEFRQVALAPPTHPRLPCGDEGS